MPKRPLLSPDEVARVHRALQKAFRQAGLGSVRRVERALNLRDGYFRAQRMYRRMDVGILLATLKELEIDPLDFFIFALGKDDDDPEGSTLAIGARSGETVTGGASKGKKPTASLADVAAWLEEMDRIREEDPEGALEQLREQADAGGIPAEHLSFFLCVCAMIHRSLGSLADAHYCLDGAERRLVRGDELRRGDIFYRRSLVVGSGGHLEEALVLATRAAEVCAARGDLVGEGKALVIRASFMIYLERFEAALEVIEKAEELLPEGETRFQFSINQYVASIFTSQGRLSEALERTEKARSFAPLGSERHTRALWSEARILKALGMTEKADANLAQVVEMMAKRKSPLEALLATAERVHLLASQGSQQKASEVGMAVVNLSRLAKGNKLAEATMVEIYRHCTSDRVDSALISQVIRRLASGTQAPKASPKNRAASLVRKPIELRLARQGQPRRLALR